jgi:hypothetical protein
LRLEQRYGFTRRTIEIESEGVRVSTRSPRGSISHVIPFWNLDPHLSEQRVRASIWSLVMGVVFCLAALPRSDDGQPYDWRASAIAVTLGLSCAVWWYLSRGRWKGYAPLMLRANRPSVRAVDEFLEAMLAAKATPPSGVAAMYRPDTLAGELEQLRTLRDDGELTPEEFDRLKAHLIDRTLGSGDEDRPGMYL